MRPDGGIRWVSSRGECRLDAAGQPEAIFGIFQDVTAKRQAAEADRLARERYETAMDTADIGLWEVDIATGEHMWSPLVCDLLGVGDTGFHRADFLKHLRPGDRELAAPLLDPASMTDNRFNATLRFDAHGRGIVFLDIRGRVIAGLDGRPSAWPAPSSM